MDFDNMNYDDQQLGANQDMAADNSQQTEDDSFDPIKKLGILDKSIDAAFEQILSKLNTQNETVISNINSINLKDFAASYKQDKKNKDESIDKKIKERIQNLDDSILSQFENLSVPKERLERYKQYSQLPYELYLATRMIQVYLDNILIKNPYTKRFIDILFSEHTEKDNSVSQTDKQVLLKIAKFIFAYFDIQKRLKNDILPKQLVLGNFFVEVINLNKFEDIENMSGSLRILTESVIDTKNTKVSFNSIKHDFGIEFDLSNVYYSYLEEQLNQVVSTTENFDIDKQINFLMNEKIDDVSYESQLLFEEATEMVGLNVIIDHLRTLDLTKIKFINLKYISPENVIILEKNGNKYGYLVIEGQEKRSASVNSNGAEQYNFINFIQNAFSGNNEKQDSKNESDFIDQILKNIFRKIKNKHNIDKISDLIKLLGSEQTIHSLKSILYDMYEKYSKVSIRYVPNENLINFTNPIDKYAPYGTSIFDTVLFPAKLYLIGLLSSIISKLNRASVIRKWTIEAGSHRNHAELIEKFKRELRNQTISFQDILKLKDVSQMVSDYKDFVTISQDGKRFVDLEILPMHDRSLPVNELEVLKNDLIAASGIPSPMLGVTDTYELREQIVNVNIIFATKIDTFQTFINESLEELVNAILKQLFILNGKRDSFVPILKYIDIKLNPPLVLILQHLESTLSSATNIINLLNQVNVPIDPIWMLKRFIKIIDWDAVKESGLKFQEELQINQTIQQEIQNSLQGQGQGGGGMF